MSIANGELLPHSRRKGFVGDKLVADRHEATRQFWFQLRKTLLGAGLLGVDNRSRRKHERHRRDRVIHVSFQSATHAARIVRDHAANGRSTGAGGIRAKPPSMFAQGGIGVSQYCTRAAAKPPASVLYAKAGPIPPYVYQDIV